jgi:copper transport protein
MTPLRNFVSAAVTAVLLAVPAVAGAHGLLRSSSPAADTALATPPSEIRLVFTEAPERAFTRVRLIGPDGHVFTRPVEILPGHVAVARIPARIGPGEYRVEWQTAGDDGHPVAGTFNFTVVQSAGDRAVAPPPDLPSSATHMSEPALTPEVDAFAGLAAVLRWLTLVGAVAAIGAIAFRYTVLARVSLEIDTEIRTDYLPDAARQAAKLGAIAAVLLLATAAARLLLQSLAIHGTDQALDTAMLSEMVTDTNWGLAWITLVAGSLAAVVGFLLVRRGRSAGWPVAAAGCAAVAIGLALASHAAVVPRLSGPSVVANMVHTIAAAGWLGNLLLVFAVGLPLAWRLDRGDRWTVVRDIVHAFSPAALAFGGLAAITGIFMAWTHVGSIAALTGTKYGNVLLLKLGLLSLTALTGAYNWLRVRPTLGDQTGARRLRRTAGAELTIATLVLAVTAVLVAVPIPVD